MKKSGIFLGLFFGLTLFVSCSSGEYVFTNEQDITLKNVTEKISSNIRWTKELDSSVVAERIIGAEGIDSSVLVSPSNVFASGAEEEFAPVYPRLPDFALLNTSMLNDSARQVLEGFCNSIISKSPADSYMDSSSIYSLVLFNYDMNREGKKFLRYVLGEPMDLGTLVECPVRFIEKDNGFQDALFYLNSEKSYKISAIEYVMKEVKDESD